MTINRTPPAPVIRFENVGQVFRRNDGTMMTAIENMSFDIGRHEFVAVLGPSGCGKSTLLRMVAGLLKPTHGSVSVYDVPVTQPRDDIGIVFQKPTLLPWLNIEDNITFPMRHKYGRVTEQDRIRAKEMLELVSLGAFARNTPDELSGGMQQRVGIARALHMNPDILLMDEPFSALDALTRDEMSFELLRIWSESPKTVIFITHSIPEALLLADRLIIMSARPGTVREIIDVPLPRPRSMDTLSDPVFLSLAAHIRDGLFSHAPH